jgi:hypothetical protein
MIKEDYAIKAKPITVRNPQASAIGHMMDQIQLTRSTQMVHLRYVKELCQRKFLFVE